MSQKNETAILVLALLITLGLVGGGLWWFLRQSGGNLGNVVSGGNNNSSSQSTTGSFARVQNVPTGLFNYGGSTSWAPIRLLVDPAIQAARPEFRLRYVDPTTGTAGSGTGIRMLLDGKIAFAQSSRPLLDQEYNQAQQRGFRLQTIPVAIDGLAVAVNPSLNIPGLTINQLRAIYTGQVTNWNQVGGLNLVITPISRSTADGGTVELFVEEVLKGGKFGANVSIVSTTTEALRKLASNPGGIYFASAPEVVPQCTIKPLAIGRQAGKFVAPYQEPLVPSAQCPGKRNQLNTEAFQKGEYPITRNLFVVVKQNGQIEEQAGLAYANSILSDRGQELITNAGFVRIR